MRILKRASYLGKFYILKSFLLRTRSWSISLCISMSLRFNFPCLRSNILLFCFYSTPFRSRFPQFPSRTTPFAMSSQAHLIPNAVKPSHNFQCKDHAKWTPVRTASTALYWKGNFNSILLLPLFLVALKRWLHTQPALSFISIAASSNHPASNMAKSSKSPDFYVATEMQYHPMSRCEYVGNGESV